MAITVIIRRFCGPREKWVRSCDCTYNNAVGGKLPRITHNCFKCSRRQCEPGSVTLVRGNHEDSAINSSYGCFSTVQVCPCLRVVFWAADSPLSSRIDSAMRRMGMIKLGRRFTRLPMCTTPLSPSRSQILNRR